MPAKRYIVSVTNEERQRLEQLTKTGKAAASKINHARILLKADINHQDGGAGQIKLSVMLSRSALEPLRE